MEKGLMLAGWGEGGQHKSEGSRRRLQGPWLLRGLRPLGQLVAAGRLLAAWAVGGRCVVTGCLGSQWPLGGWWSLGRLLAAWWLVVAGQLLATWEAAGCCPNFIFVFLVVKKIYNIFVKKISSIKEICSQIFAVTIYNNNMFYSQEILQSSIKNCNL